MPIFPENMNKLDAENTKEALSSIDGYIRYMLERIEFSFSGMSRKMTEIDTRLRALEKENADTSTETEED